MIPMPWLAALMLAWASNLALASGETTPSRPSAQASTTQAATRADNVALKPAPGGGPGKVWVNTVVKVYHCQSDPMYGRTRKGRYMTEAKAKASGALPLQDRGCSAPAKAAK